MHKMRNSGPSFELRGLDLGRFPKMLEMTKRAGLEYMDTMGKYKLEGHTPVPVEDVLEWAEWFEGHDRHVALEEVDGRKISTVFLGLDHSFGLADDGHHIPLLFETMVFASDDDPWDGWCERYSTWEQAEIGHKAVVEAVRTGGPTDEKP
jgi:hypothetical protein